MFSLSDHWSISFSAIATLGDNFFYSGINLHILEAQREEYMS